MRLPEIDFIDDQAGKPVGIQQVIGRRPIARVRQLRRRPRDAAMDDAAPQGPRFGHDRPHTDAEREWAYDRALARRAGSYAASTRRPKRGWIVVDMKNDWNAIYPGHITNHRGIHTHSSDSDVRCPCPCNSRNRERFPARHVPSVLGECADASFAIGSRSIQLRSSDSASRSVEHHLIVPPEPLEQGAADIAWLVASNLTDAALPVDGIDQEFLPRIDRQVDIVCLYEPG